MKVYCTKECFTLPYRSIQRVCGSDKLRVQIIINMYTMFIFSIVDILEVPSLDD